MEVKRKETVEDKLNKQRINFAGNIKQICSIIVIAGHEAKENHIDVFMRDEFETLQSRKWYVDRGDDEDSVKLKFPTLDECLRYVSIIAMNTACYTIDSNFTFPDIHDLSENESLAVRFIKSLAEDTKDGIPYQNREAIKNYTTKSIKLFTYKTYKFWDKIANKELNFFIEYLRGIIPHENYTNKLNLIFGRTANGTPYISDKIIDSLFHHVQLIIKSCIRFLYYYMNGNSTLFIYDDNEDRDKRTILFEVNLLKEADKWGVKLETDIF